jgi:hypothetical protein
MVGSFSSRSWSQMLTRQAPRHQPRSQWRSRCRAPYSAPLPLGDPLGEFPSLRRVRRFKPHWKWCPVVWAMPDSGEPPLQLRCIAARCAATSPALPKSSTPWSMAEIRSSIPLRVFNPSRWSKRRRALFNEGPWTHGPVTVDTVYGPRAYSTRFLVENNAIIIENSQRW